MKNLNITYADRNGKYMKQSGVTLTQSLINEKINYCWGKEDSTVLLIFLVQKMLPYPF